MMVLKCHMFALDAHYKHLHEKPLPHQSRAGKINVLLTDTMKNWTFNILYVKIKLL